MPPIKIPLLVALTVVVAQALAQCAQTSSKSAPAAQAPQSTELLLLKDAIVAEILAKTNENKKKGWNDPTVLVSACAVLITIASVTFSVFQFRKNRKDTLDWKERESRASRQAKLLDSLKWFEGGIQTRAVGIAVIEGHWLDHRELRRTWISVLTSQVVYIVSKPKARLPEHEVRNLDRLLALLRRANGDEALRGYVASALVPINRVLLELPNKTARPDKGERLTPTDRKDFIEQVLAVAGQYRDILPDSPDFVGGRL